MADFDKVTDGEITIDVTKLREQRRPLWMSPLGIDHPADMLGDGGDIWLDRLTPEWPRYYGLEPVDEGEEASQESVSSSAEMESFPPKSDLVKTIEEAFRYVHSKTESVSE